MITTSDIRPTTRPSVPVLVARGVFGLMGAVKLAGTAYFTFFASAEQGGDPQGVVDWLVVAWSTALAVAFLVLSVRLTDRNLRLIRLTGGLLLIDIAFSVVKLTAYDEPVAMAFMAVDVALLGLLALAATARRP